MVNNISVGSFLTYTASTFLLKYINNKKNQRNICNRHTLTPSPMDAAQAVGQRMVAGLAGALPYAKHEAISGWDTE